MSMQEKIKERRKALGYTQEELAEKLGLQKSAIAKYESGRVENIKRSMIKRMAAVLECSTTYLLDFEDGDKLPLAEEVLLTFFRDLNEAGQERAILTLQDLTDIERYRKE